MLPRQAAVLRPNPNIPRHQATLSNGAHRQQYRPLANGASNAHQGMPIRGQRPGIRNQMFARGSPGSAAEIPPGMANMAKPDKNKPWGWTTMDGVIVPYIMRGNERFVSVKMVESKLLSKFPKINMEDMTNVGPIYSYYITDAEAKLLTEINTRCYNHGFGAKSFTTKDLIVSLENFTSFYNRAKKHFESKLGTEVSMTSPGTSASNMSSAKTVLPERISGGWVQINNTVVPYLLRTGVKFVPLSVIKYAAGLLTDIRMDGYKVPCTDVEYRFLNHCCKTAHINFTFSIKTKLIKMEHVIRMSQSKVNIIELPNQDPFSYAQYQFERQNQGETGSHGPPVQGGYQMPLMQAPVQISPQGHPQISPQGHPQMSPPNMPLQQQMPPRNPFIPMRPGMSLAMHPGPPPPPPYRPAMGIPFQRHQIPTSVSAAMARNMRTPSPSLSPRTQAAMSMPVRPPRPQSNSNPSTPNSRPSSAQSRNSVTPPTPQSQTAPPAAAPPPHPKGNGGIKVFKFEGRNLSCLMRGEEKEPYALLEALVRLYFPQCSLADFQSALEQFLNVPVQQLSPDEEIAFIRFYELNVKSLRSKAIVSFNRFKELYTQLLYIFKAGDSSSPSEDSQDSNSAVHITSDHKPEVIDLDNELNPKSNDIVNNNTTSDTIKGNNSEDVSEEAGSKRKRGATAQSSRKSKQFCKRLEDTVAMLRQRQDPAPPEHTTSVQTSEDSTTSACGHSACSVIQENKINDISEEVTQTTNETTSADIVACESVLNDNGGDSEDKIKCVLDISPESESVMEVDNDSREGNAIATKDNDGTKLDIAPLSQNNDTINEIAIIASDNDEANADSVKSNPDHDTIKDHAVLSEENSETNTDNTIAIQGNAEVVNVITSEVNNEAKTETSNQDDDTSRDNQIIPEDNDESRMEIVPSNYDPASAPMECSAHISESTELDRSAIQDENIPEDAITDDATEAAPSTSNDDHLEQIGVTDIVDNDKETTNTDKGHYSVSEDKHSDIITMPETADDDQETTNNGSTESKIDVPEEQQAEDITQLKTVDDAQNSKTIYSAEEDTYESNDNQTDDITKQETVAVEQQTADISTTEADTSMSSDTKVEETIPETVVGDNETTKNPTIDEDASVFDDNQAEQVPMPETITDSKVTTGKDTDQGDTLVSNEDHTEQMGKPEMVADSEETVSNITTGVDTPNDNHAANSMSSDTVPDDHHIANDYLVSPSIPAEAEKDTHIPITDDASNTTPSEPITLPDDAIVMQEVENNAKLDVPEIISDESDVQKSDIGMEITEPEISVPDAVPTTNSEDKEESVIENQTSEIETIVKPETQTSETEIVVKPVDKSEEVSNEVFISNKEESGSVSNKEDNDQDDISQTEKPLVQQESGGFEVTDTTVSDAQAPDSICETSTVTHNVIQESEMNEPENTIRDMSTEESISIEKAEIQDSITQEDSAPVIDTAPVAVNMDTESPLIESEINKSESTDHDMSKQGPTSMEISETPLESSAQLESSAPVINAVPDAENMDTESPLADLSKKSVSDSISMSDATPSDSKEIEEI